jgi:hypothetical protein
VNRGFGGLLMLMGLGLLVLGALAWFGWLGWFGRLPGDVRVERGATRVYVPIVSMLLISLVVSLLAYLFRR